MTHEELCRGIWLLEALLLRNVSCGSASQRVKHARFGLQRVFEPNNRIVTVRFLFTTILFAAVSNRGRCGKFAPRTSSDIADYHLRACYWRIHNLTLRLVLRTTLDSVAAIGTHQGQFVA